MKGGRIQQTKISGENVTGRDMVEKVQHQEKAVACWGNSKATCLKHADEGERGPHSASGEAGRSQGTLMVSVTNLCPTRRAMGNHWISDA